MSRGSVLAAGLQACRVRTGLEACAHIPADGRHPVQSASLPHPAALMTDARPTRVRWLIVAMLVGLVFLAHFNRIAISVAGSERFIGPDGLSEEQMGRVYSAFL